MSATSLFNIVLKVFGISFIKDIIIALPTLLSVFYSFGDGDASGGFSTILITLLTLLVYCIVAYYFVFRTQDVIRHLRLLEDIPEDPVPLNVHRSTVVSIAIMIVALYIITEAIPLLIRGLTKWFQYNRMTNGVLNVMQPFDYSIIFVYVAEIVIGLLLLGYNRQLVNYIVLQTRKKSG